ncbi:hypothetical protein SVAN01_09649 [Stagonosporopsis vannaccii]|nr:hypothetical protein SVAN01_09649 [Stagonosporopsis vannaccii]
MLAKGTRNYERTLANGLSNSDHHNDRRVSKSKKKHSVTRTHLDLPWELRNRIHTFCVQGSYDNEVVVRRGSNAQPMLLVRQPVDAHSYRWSEDPVFLQFSSENVGLLASREILETYYRTRVFKFVHEELGCVAPFIEKCSSDLSSRPTTHLRQLHLQIHPLKYTQLHEPESMRSEQEVYCQALKSLVALRHPRTVIGVYLNLAEGITEEQDVKKSFDSAAKVISHVIGLIELLRTKGLNIRLTLEGRWDGKDGVELYSTSVASLDDWSTRIKASS